MNLISKKVWGKRKKKVFRIEEEVNWYTMWGKMKKVILSIWLIRKFIHFDSVINDELPSTSSKIVEQTEDIYEVNISGMYLSWMP